jgi:hypothetical protein
VGVPVEAAAAASDGTGQRASAFWVLLVVGRPDAAATGVAAAGDVAAAGALETGVSAAGTTGRCGRPAPFAGSGVGQTSASGQGSAVGQPEVYPGPALSGGDVRPAGCGVRPGRGPGAGWALDCWALDCCALVGWPLATGTPGASAGNPTSCGPFPAFSGLT